ncbi:MAG TPA: hemerythrin domain-containing protein [Blastocatellia bacterium]|nr:hemerythrin domain-containing protein [Blastocatellia bacterium]
MSRPFHILKHEHRIIEQVLRALDGACLRLEGGLEIPATALIEIADFINSFADRVHHRKEELLLFPALERRGITREGGPLGAIEREHEIERKLVGQFRVAIAEYIDGDAEAGRRFVEAARTLIRMLVGHIETEDSILFRIGDEVLDDNDKAALIEGFNRFHGEIGIRPMAEYERMARELEDKWAF